jgi:hypothetical protein
MSNPQDYNSHQFAGNSSSTQFGFNQAPAARGVKFAPDASAPMRNSAVSKQNGVNRMRRSMTSPVALSSMTANDKHPQVHQSFQPQIPRTSSYHQFPPTVYQGQVQFQSSAASQGMFASQEHARSFSGFNANVNNNAMRGAKPEQYAPIGSRSLSSSPSSISAGQSGGMFDSSRKEMAGVSAGFRMSQDVHGMRRVQSSPMDLASLDDGTEVKSTKRLAKKAEAARASRRRKKVYIQSLEEKFSRLSARLAELEAGPDQARAMIHEAQKNEQKEIRQRLDDILSNPDADCYMEEIRELLSAYIQNGRKKQNTAEYYLGRCETALTPSLQVKFAMWGLGQTDDFYDQPGIWRTIMGEEIGLSEQQLQEMKRFRDAVQQARGSLQNVCGRLKKLKDNVRIHIANRERHVDELAGMLNPLQIAKFCNWVDKNPLCMQMLNTVWKI